MSRFAFIPKGHTRREVEVYLPGNYKVVAETSSGIVIGGNDNAGWTLDDYVIPRLGSGLIFAKEVWNGWYDADGNFVAGEEAMVLT